jgi:cytidine deaminase
VKSVTWEALSPLYQQALTLAREALAYAYNPYSHFSVGACLITQTGEFITGTNFENASYTSICAERSALVRANVMGHRTFQAIAILAKGQINTTEVCAPCGTCRQALYEAAQLSGGNLELILSTTACDKIVLTDIRTLLPMAFGPKDLNIDIASWTN